MCRYPAILPALFAAVLGLAQDALALTQQADVEALARQSAGNYVSSGLPRADLYALESMQTSGAVNLAVFEMIDFVSNGTIGLLRWATMSEEENAGFEIEYRPSGLGADFVSVGFVAGSGTTDERHAYRFGVRNMRPGAHEFRIKVSAKDGRFRYTEPIRFEIERERMFALGAAAHDAEEGVVYVPYTIEKPGIVRLIIEDNEGRLVTTLAFGTHAPGTHVASFQTGERTPRRGTIWMHTEEGSTSREFRLD